jgi:hypothetical protein
VESMKSSAKVKGLTGRFFPSIPPGTLREASHFDPNTAHPWPVKRNGSGRQDDTMGCHRSFWRFA